MNVIEQELKLLLDLDGFNCILHNQKNTEKTLKQTNYYFDTNTLELQSSGITLRIREENEEVILCFKSKISKTLFVTSQEVEQKVSHEILNHCIANPVVIISLFPENIQELLKSKFINEKLEFLGSLKNTRHCLSLVENFTFELDHSELPNGEHSYELEVEGVTRQEDCEFIMNLLRENDINFLLNDKSKYERFLEAINML